MELRTREGRRKGERRDKQRILLLALLGSLGELSCLLKVLVGKIGGSKRSVDLSVGSQTLRQFLSLHNMALSCSQQQALYLVILRRVRAEAGLEKGSAASERGAKERHLLKVTQK